MRHSGIFSISPLATVGAWAAPKLVGETLSSQGCDVRGEIDVLPRLDRSLAPPKGHQEGGGRLCAEF